MKKRLVLLSASIILFACNHYTSDASNQITTTSNPVIKNVAYDTSDTEVKSVMRLQGKDGVLHKLAITTSFDTSDMNEEQRKLTVKIMRDRMKEDGNYKKINDIAGVSWELQLKNNTVEMIVMYNFDELDYDKYQIQTGEAVYVDLFGQSAKDYKKTISLDDAEVLLQKKGSKKIENE